VFDKENDKYKAFAVMKIKKFTFVNDCFHDKSNAVVGVFLQALIINFLFLSCSTMKKITQLPTQIEFQDIEEVVSLFETQMPVTMREQIANYNIEDLNFGIAASYNDSVLEYNSANRKIKKAMIVQYSSIIMDASLDTFLKVIPIEKWGQYLSGWKEGEVKEIPAETNMDLKYQAERMVLGLGNDMTKAEVIKKTDSTASVFWRVYHSDNNSTLSDIGKLEIISLGKTKIKVIFHSAHDLKFYGLIRIPKYFVHSGLKQTFLKHLRNYKKIVTGSKIK